MNECLRSTLSEYPADVKIYQEFMLYLKFDQQHHCNLELHYQLNTNLELIDLNRLNLQAAMFPFRLFSFCHIPIYKFARF